MIPIPAIDLKGGKCVRLLKGEMEHETIYGDNPLQMAKKWESEGAKRLHIVDLDGAVGGHPVHRPVICEIAKTVSIPVEVGGGIRTLPDMEAYLSCGVHTVIVGTAAFLNPELLKEAVEHFPNHLAIALDTRENAIVVRGWQTVTSEEIDPWIKKLNKLPIFAIIHTDVGRDGTEQGPNTRALQSVLGKSARSVIASGGVGALSDLETLKKIETTLKKKFLGVIIGKALYEENFSLKDATRLLEGS